MENNDDLMLDLDDLADVSGGMDRKATFQYTVVRGDTVEKIATKLNRSAMKICKLNSLKMNAKLAPGTFLLIPYWP